MASWTPDYGLTSPIRGEHMEIKSSLLWGVGNRGFIADPELFRYFQRCKSSMRLKTETCRLSVEAAWKEDFKESRVQRKKGRFFLQFATTKGADPSLLNKHSFHHLNRFAIVYNLLDDIGIVLPIILSVRKTALLIHSFTPFRKEPSFFRNPAGQKVDLKLSLIFTPR